MLTEALLKQCLVLALRRWIELEASPLPLLPWLAGVADTRLSRALRAVFEQPAAAFTVEGLAMLAGMSRFGIRRRIPARLWSIADELGQASAAATRE